MTDERKEFIAKKLQEWEAQTLLTAYGGYYSRLADLSENEMEKFGLIRKEILRRMG